MARVWAVSPNTSAGMAAALPRRGTRWPAHQATGRPTAEQQSPRSGQVISARCASPRKRPLEAREGGQGGSDFGSHVIAFWQSRADSASGGDFQVQPRPPVRLQLAEHQGASISIARPRRWYVRGREKVQIQALTHSAGARQWGRGCPPAMTHDYIATAHQPVRRAAGWQRQGPRTLLPSAMALEFIAFMARGQRLPESWSCI